MRVRKFLSILLSILCVASCVVIAPTSVSADTENLFLDGSFEELTEEQNPGRYDASNTATDDYTDLTKWWRPRGSSNYSGNTRAGSTEDARTGTRSLKLSVTSNYGNQYIFYKNIAVEKNTEYTISFWYKMTEATDQFRGVITTAFNENATGRLGYFGSTNSIICTTVTDGWVKAECTFNSGENELVRILFRLIRSNTSTSGSVTGNNTVFVDDIVMTSAESSDTETTVNNIFPNGDFEDAAVSFGGGTSGNTQDVYNKWYRQGYTGTSSLGSTEEKHGGNQSFKIGSTSASNGTTASYRYYLNFEVKPQTDYIFSFWYNITALDSASSFRGAISSTAVVAPDSNNCIVALGASNSIIETSATDGWVKRTVSFNSGEYSVLRLAFQLYTGQATTLSTLYVDDIILQEVADTGLITNGSFELDLAGWTMNPATYWKATVNTDEYYEGGASAQLGNTESSGNARLYQDFKVEPNRKYQLSFWYKGGANYQNYWGIRDTSGTTFARTDRLYGQSLSTATEWTQVTQIFESNDYNVMRLGFNSGKGATMYIDAVSITEVEEEHIISNGGFEANTENWVTDGDITAKPENHYGGSYSAEMLNGSTAYQDFTVGADQGETVYDYRLWFYYKGSAGTKYEIFERDGETVSDTATVSGTLEETADWTKITAEFKPRGQLDYRVVFTSAGDSYIDDVNVDQFINPIPDTPNAPVYSSNTQSSVTLVEDSKLEYSIDGVSWRSTPVFTGLLAGVEYSFYCRIAPTEERLPSNASEPMKFKITANGDADGDGVIKATDLVVLRKSLLKVDVTANKEGLDSNGDGVTDLKDLVRSKKTLAVISDNTKILIDNVDIEKYVIVNNNKTSLAINACEKLKTAIKDFSGYDIPVVEASDSANIIELILTDDTDQVPTVTVENGKVTVTAGTDYQAMEILTVLSDSIAKAEKAIYITKNFAMTESYNKVLAAKGDYDLVWSDEFEGSQYKTDMWGYTDGSLGDNVSVADGILTLNSNSDSGIDLISNEKINYLYGKAEIKAKISSGSTATAIKFINSEDSTEYVNLLEYAVDDGLYHTYALEWTADSAFVTVDGEKKADVDMSAVGEGTVSFALSAIAGDKEEALNVDYVRLYQKTGEGKLEGSGTTITRDLSWKTHPEDYKLVAFTFDDAPQFFTAEEDNATRRIMDTFTKYNGSATLFVIGGGINNYGVEVLKYAIDNGFELGNHQLNHGGGITNLDVEGIKSEITGLQDLLDEKLGFHYEMKFFRSSGLQSKPELYEAATALDIPVIFSSVGASDWDPATTVEEIISSCLSAGDGDIVLLHAGGDNTATAIEEAIPQLYEQGFRFVTLSELFEYKGIHKIRTDIPIHYAEEGRAE